MRFRLSSFTISTTLAILGPLAACSSPNDGSGGSGGAVTSVGGTGTGGTSSGGVSSGGLGSGGLLSSGGQVNGGASSGGVTSSGGAASGGKSTGLGGASGSASGGASTTGSGGGETQPATWATVKAVLTGTQPPCNSSLCHGNGTMNPNAAHPFLVVDDENKLYTTITTYVTTSAAGSVPLVDKSNPANSGLVQILKGPLGNTPRMPAGCDSPGGGDNCVPPEYIAAITQWIANGAKMQ
jgi:hypothetical protein